MSISEQERITQIQQDTMPFVNDPPVAVTFYEGMGRMAILWGRLEQSLDDLLIAAILVAKGKDDYDIYTSLARKLKLLKSLYYNCQDLKHLHGRATSLAADITMNSDNRNPLIHASLLRFEDGNPPRMVMRNLKYEDRGSLTVTTLSPSVSDLGHMLNNFHLCRAKILLLFSDTVEIWKKVQARADAPARHSPPSE